MDNAATNFAAMDETEQAHGQRVKLLSTPCLHCGRTSGWCITPGGHEIRNVFKQHGVRYRRAATTVRELRALMVKARLI